MGEPSKALLRVENMFKSFGPTKAIAGVSMELDYGEVRGLIGENGSGKSTLSNMITGIYAPDSGQMFLRGKVYTPHTVQDSQLNGIGMLVQESNTINGLTVWENIFLGKEKGISGSLLVNRRKLIEEAKKALENIGESGIDPKAFVDSYSFEERKLMEVAAALYFDPDLLIIDETTTALAAEDAERIHRIIAERKAKGKSVLFISHDLDELRSVCDSVTVLRDGQYIDTLRGDFTVQDMRLLMIGRELTGQYYREDEQGTYQEEVLLKVENLTYGEIVQNINFELHKGEILGFGGLAESGTHELCKILFGVIKADSGTATMLSSGQQLTSTEIAVANKVAYLPKDRDRESLLLNASIQDNITLASFEKNKKRGLLDRKAERKLAQENAEKLSVKMQSVSQMVKALSGGNKQKVVVAKWLANDSELLIMDSPTRGIDIGVKAAIYRMMENLKAQGKGIILVSDEMSELRGMADRVIVLKDGKQTAEFDRSAELTEKALIQAMM